MSYWSSRQFHIVGCADPWFYAVLRVLCGLIIVPFYRYRVTGSENTPARDGVILAVTHKSWFDPIFSAMAFRRPLRFMAKSELFENTTIARFISHLGAFSIKRKSADIEALRASLGIIAAGEILLMFPEGHRYHDDVVHEFQPGIAMLAARSGAPVLPVAIRGSKHLLWHKLPLAPHVRVGVGPPVDLSDVGGRRSEAYAAAAEKIRQAVSDLYDQI